MLPALKLIRRFASCLMLLGLVGLMTPAGAEPPLPQEMIGLPDGQQVLIGDQGAMLLDAADSGRLEDVLRSLVDAGRWDDGLAILIYVARHRPGLTDGLTSLGLALLATPDRAEQVGSILAAIVDAGNGGSSDLEPSMVVSSPDDAAIDIASLEPASGPPDSDNDDAGASVEPPPVDPASQPVSYGSAGGGGGGGIGGGLPAGLFIGSSGGGAGGEADDQSSPNPGVVDPPADGGVS